MWLRVQPELIEDTQISGYNADIFQPLVPSFKTVHLLKSEIPPKSNNAELKKKELNKCC